MKKSLHKNSIMFLPIILFGLAYSPLHAKNGKTETESDIVFQLKNNTNYPIRIRLIQNQNVISITSESEEVVGLEGPEGWIVVKPQASREYPTFTSPEQYEKLTEQYKKQGKIPQGRINMNQQVEMEFAELEYCGTQLKPCQGDVHIIKDEYGKREKFITARHLFVTFTEGKIIFIKWDGKHLLPQAGKFHKTEEGYSLKNNVTKKDIHIDETRLPSTPKY